GGTGRALTSRVRGGLVPHVTRARTVGATLEQVWELVSDPFHLPRWWPATARVEDVEDDAWTSVLKTPSGKTVRADFTRVERRPRRMVAWRQELEESPFERVVSSADTKVELDEKGGDATRVALTSEERLRGRYRLGGWVVRRAARRRLDEALDGIERAVAPE
ncbi:MAG TPA: SRPBCC family protein, partial [Solirubrobacteraceae bacterium]